MIGDDDFFMQNADYHYGASDTEKMYGRNYSDSSNYIGGHNSGSFGQVDPTALMKMMTAGNIALQEF